MKRFSRANLEGSFSKTENKYKEQKRRQHINFKIEIKTKKGIDTVINFLKKDIKKRLYVDKKYELDNNECHLKHLNFIFMEILLQEVLEIFKINYDTNFKNECKEKDNIKENILYVPEKSYIKDLTIISRKDIEEKYARMNNQKYIDQIAKYIYTNYKSFGFINLNFLKRKIYEFI